jgi:hypothetical protein
MSIKTLFAPDFARYEGVRPINVYALRLFYFLMAAFVATDAWRTIITHEGPWDRFRAMAFCVWAVYPTLAVLGLIHPLRMLPIMLFTVAYKGLWLLIVAYPLWRAGTLAGSPAETMTRAFIWTPLLIIAIPWGYVFRHYVMWPRTQLLPEDPRQGMANIR